MNEASFDIYDEEYIHQFQPGNTHKYQQQLQKHRVWRYHPIEHLENYHKDHPNPYQSSHKLRNEKEQSFLSLKEVNENWDNNRIRISQLGKGTAEQILESEGINQMSRTVRVTVSNSSRKLHHLSKFVRDRKIIADSTKSISSTRTVFPAPTGCKVLVILSVKQTLPYLVNLLSFPKWHCFIIISIYKMYFQVPNLGSKNVRKQKMLGLAN